MQAHSISAVVNFLRDVLEANEFFSDLWVVGEVSNYTKSVAGHRYFSLNDEKAALRTVLFRDSMPGMALQNGDRVLAHGKVTLYPQRGELQFVSDFVRPEGVGLAAARFEELRLRLEAEGLFDPARKRLPPRFPRCIGVVTSPTGAAINDISRVLALRWPLATIVLAPAMVQGDTAVPQLIAAFRDLARQPGLEVAIVARGGGSAEDLSAFNDERVARAIYGFPVPVVSGVGHERDTTIADLVADVRAPTPSAAAERATPDIAETRRAVLVLERAMASAARQSLGANAALVQGGLSRLRRNGPDLAARAASVREAATRIQTCAERALASSRSRFEAAEARIGGLDPGATLRRGFAIVQHASTRKVVSSVRRVKPGQRLSVSVSDGSFWTEVS